MWLVCDGFRFAYVLIAVGDYGLILGVLFDGDGANQTWGVGLSTVGMS